MPLRWHPGAHPRSQALDLSVGTGVPFSATIDAGVEFVTHPQVMATYPYLATVVLVVTTRHSLLDTYSRELE